MGQLKIKEQFDKFTLIIRKRINQNFLSDPFNISYGAVCSMVDTKLAIIIELLIN